MTTGEVNGDVLKFTLVHGSKKYPVELPIDSSNDGPTVEDLANLAARLTDVPRGSQRLIFKGQSLTELSQSLKSLRVKNGSRIMLIGKKFDPSEEENMKAILAAEKKADDIEKRLTENVEELQGVEKGFLQTELVNQTLDKLTRKGKGITEDLMKTLETLDALPLASCIFSASSSFAIGLTLPWYGAKSPVADKKLSSEALVKHSESSPDETCKYSFSELSIFPDNFPCQEVFEDSCVENLSS